MTGTMCDNCKKIKTVDEQMHKMKSTWVNFQEDGAPFVQTQFDFCCKKCLLEYLLKQVKT